MPLPPPARQTASDHQARLLLGLLGDDAKKGGTAAINARLAEARRLGAQAGDVSLDPELRRAAKARAAAVLAGDVPVSVPWTPAAAIAKATASRQPLACCDSRGRLYGVCDPRAVSAAVAGRVRKSAGTPIYDANGTLLGGVDPSLITPVIVKASEIRKAVRKARKAAKKARKSSAAVRAAYERKAAGKALPGDRDGDDHGWGTNSASPAVQARNRGPVDDGGTTGFGLPRRGGGQWHLPGDAAGRAIVKSGKKPGRR